MTRILLVLAILLVSATLSFAQGSSCATATPVIPGNSASGSITNSVTIHYWKITTPSNGYLRIQANSEVAVDLSLVLYDSDTTNVISNDSQTGPYSEVFGLLKPGTYYVKVFRVNGTGTYSMSTAFTAPPRADDPEPNNTAALAAPLNPNGTATGNIGFFGNRTGDSEDYWKIKVTEDGYLRVRVQADSLDLRGDGPYFQLDADMFDTNGTSRITYDFRVGTFSEVWQFVRPGTYFVHLYLVAGRAASYQITSELFPPSRPNDVDGNDSPQTATLAVVNGTVTGHVNYLCGGIFDADDYWKFTLPSDGKVTVQLFADSLDAAGTTMELDLALYEVNGTRLDRISFDARNGTFSECTMDLVAGRTFYPRVTRVAGHGASYSMKITHTPVSRASDIEPNDWFGAANLLTLNTLSTGHMGYFGYGSSDMYDFWKITATTSDSLYVHVTSDPTLEVNLAGWGPDTLLSFPLVFDNRAGIYSRVGIKPTAGVTYYFRVDRIFSLPSWYSIIATRTSFAVAVEENAKTAVVPKTLALEQNYPNPFNPSTTIRYDLPKSQTVKITIFSLLGQEVAELVNTVQSPGSYRVNWDGKDHHGNEMPSGIYAIRLLAGNTQLVKKAMLVR